MLQIRSAAGREDTEVSGMGALCRVMLCTMSFWVDMISSFVPLVWALAAKFGWVRGIPRAVPLLHLLQCWRIGGLAAPPEAEWLQKLSVFWPLAAVCFVAHLYGCIWFATRDLSGRDEDPFHGDLNMEVYIAALSDGSAMVCGLSSPVAENDFERLVLAMLFPISSTILAWIFAQLVVISGRLTVISTRQHEHMAYINSAAAQLGIGKELRRKMMRYHLYAQQHHNENMYHTLLSSMPQPLLIEMKLELFQHFICKSALVQSLSKPKVVQLILAFEETVYCPGDTIVRLGDVGTEMFFIVKGSCDVFSEDWQLLTTKNKGDYFGEICLLFPEMTRTAHVRVNTFSVLAKLPKDKLDTIIPEGTEERTKMRERVATFSNVNVPGHSGEDCSRDREHASPASRGFHRLMRCISSGLNHHRMNNLAGREEPNLIGRESWNISSPGTSASPVRFLRNKAVSPGTSLGIGVTEIPSPCAYEYKEIEDFSFRGSDHARFLGAKVMRLELQNKALLEAVNGLRKDFRAFNSTENNIAKMEEKTLKATKCAL